MSRKRAVFVDVDRTLIAADGALRPHAVEFLQGLRQRHFKIYLWSAGGARCDVVERNGLAAYIKGSFKKPFPVEGRTALILMTRLRRRLGRVICIDADRAVINAFGGILVKPYSRPDSNDAELLTALTVVEQQGWRPLPALRHMVQWRPLAPRLMAVASATAAGLFGLVQLLLPAAVAVRPLLQAQLAFAAPTTVVTTNAASTISMGKAFQSRSFRASDGTLAALVQVGTQVSPNGLVLRRSTDSGATWTDGGFSETDSCTTSTAISSTTTHIGSGYMDGSNNIFVVYGLDTDTAATADDIFFRKLTFQSANRCWTVGAEKTVFDGLGAASDNNWARPDIVLDSTGAIWVAAKRIMDASVLRDISVRYATDGTGDTWTDSNLTLASATGSADFTVALLVRFGAATPDKIMALYNDNDTGLYYRWRADSDTKTSWNTEATIFTSTSLDDGFNVTWDSAGNVHVARRHSGTDGVLHHKCTCTGASPSWDTTGITLGEANTDLNPAVATADETDDTGSHVSVWVVWREQPTGSSSVRRIVFKKSTDGGVSFGSVKQGVSDATFNKVFITSSGGTSFTDETVDANDQGTADISVMFGSDSDALYLGSTLGTFTNITIKLSTAGTAATAYTWQYSTGTSTFTTFSGEPNFAFDSTTQNTDTFTAPGDWTKGTVNGVSAYWVRAVVTTAPATQPVGSFMFASAAPDANDLPSVPRGPISSMVPVVWLDTTPSPDAVKFSSIKVNTGGGPTAVTAGSVFVRRAARGGGVDIEWRTRSEYNVVGFHVYAVGLADGFERRRLTATPVSALFPGAVTGSAYTLRLAAAPALCYGVEELLVDGSSTLYNPVCIP